MSKYSRDEIQAFGAELAGRFKTETDPRFRDHYWAFAFMLGNDVRVFADWSGNIVQYSLHFVDSDGASKPLRVSAGCNATRGTNAAAGVIRDKLIPAGAEPLKAARELRKEQLLNAKRMEKKRDQLQRKYDFAPLVIEDNRIAIRSKYGAHVDCRVYIYYDAPADKWRLSSQSRVLYCDDLETKSGRALLRALAA